VTCPLPRFPSLAPLPRPYGFVQRYASGAADSRSEARAEAGGSQLHALVRGELPCILGHGLIASAQKPNSVSTTCASVKAAAVSISGNPLCGCPE
jgi:hypothetical protein